MEAIKTERIPELREFVKENNEKLFSFCYYMLQEDYVIEDFALSVFREFGEIYRRISGSKEGAWEPFEIRLRLFKLAWERLRDAIATQQFSWTGGRDTRQMKGLDQDLLKEWAATSASDGAIANLDTQVVARLRKIDPDFRAPVVLRDVLAFEDEELVRILGVRWGVYRHRLHRGRLEVRDALRGMPSLQMETGMKNSSKEAQW